MKSSDSVDLSCHSCKDWSRGRYNSAAFGALLDSAINWSKWGTTEPYDAAWSLTARVNFLNLWTQNFASAFGSIGLRDENQSNASAMFCGTHGPTPHASWFSASCPQSRWARLNKEFETLWSDLSMSLDCFHGWICDSREHYAQHYSEMPNHEHGTTKIVMLGVGYRKALPGVYQANLFGPPVTEWLAEDRIRSCPCHEYREIAPGYHVVVAYPDVLSHDTPEAVAAKDAIREHLGVEHFYDRRFPERKTIAPPLDWSELYRPPPPRDPAKEAELKRAAREMGGWLEVNEGEMRLHLDGTEESDE